MKPVVKRVLLGVAGLLGVGVVGAGAYVGLQARAYEASLEKVYDLPLPAVKASTDPTVIARGEHLVRSLGGCAIGDCHGADLAGGRPLKMGPVGTFTGPNITPAGFAAVYSDGEMARLIRYGVKKDGRSLRFMPVQDFSWLPDRDLEAIVSYLRTVAPVQKPSGEVRVGLLGKVLDRRGAFRADVARHLEPTKHAEVPEPTPTAAYGRYVARLCTGCHGEGLSGGPIPGAPPGMAVPTNLTPHATGLAGWTYDDFSRLFATGQRRDGRKLDPIMPVEAVARMNDVERLALWEYVRSVPPLPSGQR